VLGLQPHAGLRPSLRLQRLGLLLASNLASGECGAIWRMPLSTWRKGIRQMGSFHFQKLDSYSVAKQIAVRVHAMKIGQSELRDQAERAALSSFLNLSEGLAGRQAGVRRRHFAIALGSLGEVAAALDIGVALGLVPADADLDELVSRLGAMLGALMR
ncbi:MAG: four helix bundle protein, partial [Polyangiaceae bacterium]